MMCMAVSLCVGVCMWVQMPEEARGTIPIFLELE